MSDIPPAGSRERHREQIKARIRRAASELFAERGLEATGVREIAAAAGVNPAIVIRHFGSKEALFLETISFDSELYRVLDGPLDRAGRAVVRHVLETDNRSWRVFSALFRASARPEVSARLRRAFEEEIAPRLVPRLEGEHALLRARLFIAQMTGLLTALSLYDSSDLGGASPEAIVELYGDAMQGLLTPPEAPCDTER